jgi:hypothetical protein
LVEKELEEARATVIIQRPPDGDDLGSRAVDIAVPIERLLPAHLARCGAFRRSSPF